MNDGVGCVQPYTDEIDLRLFCHTSILWANPAPLGDLMTVLRGLFLAEDVAHAADLGADAAELFFDVLVAAVHVVDAVEDGFAFGDQRGEDERGGGAEIRAHDGGGLERRTCRGRWRSGR